MYVYIHIYIYIEREREYILDYYIYIYIYTLSVSSLWAGATFQFCTCEGRVLAGGTKRATSVNTPLPRRYPSQCHLITSSRLSLAKRKRKTSHPAR